MEGATAEATAKQIGVQIGVQIVGGGPPSTPL